MAKSTEMLAASEYLVIRLYVVGSTTVKGMLLSFLGKVNTALTIRQY
jgi:hypothetical protein